MTAKGLRLVDYDGMFVPSMSTMIGNELGHRNYQHPLRSSNHFGAFLDNFSAWVIYCSLRAITVDPGLIQDLEVTEECLLFRREDFLSPLSSSTFAALERHDCEELRALGQFIRYHLLTDPAKLPPLGLELNVGSHWNPFQISPIRNLTASGQREEQASSIELNDSGKTKKHQVESELMLPTPRQKKELQRPGETTFVATLSGIAMAGLGISGFAFYCAMTGPPGGAGQLRRGRIHSHSLAPNGVVVN